VQFVRKGFEGVSALCQTEEWIMSNLRVLTEAELDIVSGGLGYTTMRSVGCSGMATFGAQPSEGSNGLKLAETIIVDVLRVLEPCGSNRKVLQD
jgi:hypothetical protein